MLFIFYRDFSHLFRIHKACMPWSHKLWQSAKCCGERQRIWRKKIIKNEKSFQRIRHPHKRRNEKLTRLAKRGFFDSFISFMAKRTYARSRSSFQGRTIWFWLEEGEVKPEENTWERIVRRNNLLYRGWTYLDRTKIDNSHVNRLNNYSSDEWRHCIWLCLSLLNFKKPYLNLFVDTKLAECTEWWILL